MFYVDIDGKRRRVYKQSDGGFYMYVTKRSKKSVGKKGVYEANPIPRKTKIPANLSALMSQNKALQKRIDDLEKNLDDVMITGSPLLPLLPSSPGVVPSPPSPGLSSPPWAPSPPSVPSPVYSIDAYNALMLERDELIREIEKMERDFQNAESTSEEQLQRLADLDNALIACKNELEMVRAELTRESSELSGQSNELSLELRKVRVLYDELKKESGDKIRAALEESKADCQQEIDVLKAEYDAKIDKLQNDCEFDKELLKAGSDAEIAKCENKLNSVIVEKEGLLERLLTMNTESNIESNSASNTESGVIDCENQLQPLREQIAELEDSIDKQANSQTAMISKLQEELRSECNGQIENTSRLFEDAVSNLENENNTLKGEKSELEAVLADEQEQLIKCNKQTDENVRQFKDELKAANERFETNLSECENRVEECKSTCELDIARERKINNELDNKYQQCKAAHEDDTAELTQIFSQNQELINESGRLSAKLDESENIRASIESELGNLHKEYEIERGARMVFENVIENVYRNLLELSDVANAKENTPSEIKSLIENTIQKISVPLS